MAEQKVTQKMFDTYQKSRSPRSLAGRNRRINQVRKATKHRDMGIYAKRKSPATRPRKA